MQVWEDLVDRIKNPRDEITIHVVGKYVGYEDSYKSLNEALYHGGFPHRLKVNIKWIEAEALEEPGGAALLDDADGILVPGGFGDRGTRGMMKAAQIARERRIPYFGICYGFQWATVEYARNVAGLADADSTECSPDTPTKVIYKLRDLLGVDDLGGTMRLGAYACELTPGSLAQRVYGVTTIHERHRHRYEFNCLYERTLDRARSADFRTLAGRQGSSRSPSCQGIRGISPFSSTRSSSRSRRTPIRSSPHSSRPATAQDRARRAARGRVGRLSPSASPTALRGRIIRFRRGRSCLDGRSPRLRTHLTVPYNGRRDSCADWRHRLRRRAPVRPHRRSVRHRRRAPGRRSRRAARGDRAAPGCALCLQGLFRQGESHVGRVVSRSGPRRRPAHPRRHQGALERSDPDRHPRAVDTRDCRRRSPTCCRFQRFSAGRPTCSWPRRRRAAPSTSRKVSSWRPTTCGTPWRRSSMPEIRGSSSPNAARASAITISSWTCARFP